MKTKLALCLAVVLLAGCSPFNTVMLYRDNTPFEAFLYDRQACVAEASKCVSSRFPGSSYVENLYPSRPVYLSCMWSRGYEPVASNGFVSPVLVAMTDYPPSRDCR